MKRWLSFILAGIIFLIIHEGTHVITALIFGEYEAFQLRSFGMEITFNTPVVDRSGFQWAFISGTSNLLTLLTGYVLLIYSDQFSQLRNWFWKVVIYYSTMLLLLLDAFNLSIGPFIYGGDANGIAVGLGINRYFIQGFFFLVLLINRELIAQKLLPAYKVKTNNLLFKPFIKFKH